MALTTLQQFQALRDSIAADPVLSQLPHNDDSADAIVQAYKLAAAPDFWVWRTTVTRSEIYNTQNDLAISGAQTGFWQWDIYKAQSQGEQGAWVQMFMGDSADFSKQNLRDGIGKIFTGSAAANAQRDHCLAIGRRKANRAEKLFASGTGSTASPATMTISGSLSISDVTSAWNS